VREISFLPSWGVGFDLNGLLPGRKQKMKKKIFMLFCAVTVLSVMALLPASAAEAPLGDDWRFSGDLYLWGASIGGTAATGGDIDVGFDDLIDNLDFAFMGVLGAYKGKWSVLVDLIYLDVSAENKSRITVPVGPGFEVRGETKVDLSSWVVTPTLGFNLLKTKNVELDLVAGARYLYLKGQFKVRADLPRRTVRVRASDSGDVWDGIAGIRGKVVLTENWYLPFYCDIGTGESDMTWQALAGTGYHFGRFDVMAGYRYMDWNFDDNDVFDDLNLSGPYLGLMVVF
jgi:hypothetical protein